MNKNSNGARKTILMGGLMAVGIGLAVGAIASANPGMFQKHNKEGFKKGFEMTEEKKEAMKAHYEQMDTILANGDYEAFKELASNKPMMADKITEENFAKFIEMHNLKQAGDMEGAKVIAEELGLMKLGEKGKKGMHKGMRFEDKNGDGFCDHLDKE